MKKNAGTRSNVLLMVEMVIWISASLYARFLLDALAERWSLQPPWPLLMKIVTVLGLIGLALLVHGLLVRWLARAGWLPPEGKG